MRFSYIETLVDPAFLRAKQALEQERSAPRGFADAAIQRTRRSR